MTLELLLFLVLFIWMFVAILFEGKKSIDFFSFALLAIYCYVVRSSGFDSDILVYEATINYDWHTFADLYYLREFVFWISLRFLGEVIGDPTHTFIIIDLITLYLIFIVKKRLSLPSYSIVLFFLFFAGNFGLQNVYRQFIATVLFMLSLSYLNKPIIASFLLMLAGFTHNVIFLFAPLFVRKRDSLIYRALFYISSIIFIFILGQAISTKSSGATGMDVAVFYLVIQVVLFIFLSLILPKGNTLKSHVGRELIVDRSSSILFYFSLIVAAMYFMAGSGIQSERLGMLTLHVSIMLMSRVVWMSFKQPRIVSTIISFVLVIPSLVSPSSIMFLQTVMQ